MLRGRRLKREDEKEKDDEKECKNKMIKRKFKRTW